jgi:hypothetical protein
LIVFSGPAAVATTTTTPIPTSQNKRQSLPNKRSEVRAAVSVTEQIQDEEPMSTPPLSSPKSLFDDFKFTSSTRSNRSTSSKDYETGSDTDDWTSKTKVCIVKDPITEHFKKRP